MVSHVGLHIYFLDCLPKICVKLCSFQCRGYSYWFISIKNEYFQKMLTVYLNTWKVLSCKNNNILLNFKCFINTKTGPIIAIRESCPLNSETSLFRTKRDISWQSYVTFWMKRIFLTSVYIKPLKNGIYSEKLYKLNWYKGFQNMAKKSCSSERALIIRNFAETTVKHQKAFCQH